MTDNSIGCIIVSEEGQTIEFRRLRKMFITENYRIIAEDDRNIILQKKTTPKDPTKEGSWKNDGYFTDFKSALKVLAKREILSDGLADYERICAKIELLYKYIDNQCNI